MGNSRTLYQLIGDNNRTGMSLDAIAEVLGCSRAAVQLIEKSALAKCRERLLAKGYTVGDLIPDASGPDPLEPDTGGIDMDVL